MLSGGEFYPGFFIGHSGVIHQFQFIDETRLDSIVQADQLGVGIVPDPCYCVQVDDKKGDNARQPRKGKTDQDGIHRFNPFRFGQQQQFDKLETEKCKYKEYGDKDKHPGFYMLFIGPVVFVVYQSADIPELVINPHGINKLVIFSIVDVGFGYKTCVHRTAHQYRILFPVENMIVVRQVKVIRQHFKVIPVFLGFYLESFEK
jgi:hypothetical protein